MHLMKMQIRIIKEKFRFTSNEDVDLFYFKRKTCLHADFENKQEIIATIKKKIKNMFSQTKLTMRDRASGPYFLDIKKVNDEKIEITFFLCVEHSNVRDRAPGPFYDVVEPNPHEWVESCYCLSKQRFNQLYFPPQIRGFTMESPLI